MTRRFTQEENTAAEEEAEVSTPLESVRSIVANRNKSPLAAVSAAAETMWWWIWHTRRYRGRRPRRR